MDQSGQKNSGLADVALGFDLDMRRYTIPEIDLLYALLFFGELGRFKMKLSEETGLIYDFRIRVVLCIRMWEFSMSDIRLLPPNWFSQLSCVQRYFVL